MKESTSNFDGEETKVLKLQKSAITLIVEKGKEYMYHTLDWILVEKHGNFDETLMNFCSWIP